ncbi:hypothetical protein [Streptomyces sp. NPDC049879]|uniref:hypothetical protein n=1 Tax=Streptomyces sp. NPDC049879 TaxID=3365598 RepID=UPI0037963A4D
MHAPRTEDWAGITGLYQELIPVRPPAPARCAVSPLTPEQISHNRAVLYAAVYPRRRKTSAAERDTNAGAGADATGSVR